MRSDALVCLAFRMAELTGFTPDSTVGPLGRVRVLRPLAPGWADGSTVGDELAAWLGFNERVDEAHMFGGVRALLHVFVDNPHMALISLQFASACAAAHAARG